MDTITNLKLLETLLLLLPGFVTAEIVGQFVLREERKALDRIIQALIYTFLAHLVWTPLSRLFPTSTAWNLAGLGAVAVALGVLFTWLISTGTVHALLRKASLTKSASRPNEWYDAFYDSDKYVILHLKDGRRIPGWPRIYPFRPERGHILLETARWLDRWDSAGEMSEVENIDFLINVTDVRFVEFVPQKTGGHENA